MKRGIRSSSNCPVGHPQSPTSQLNTLNIVTSYLAKLVPTHQSISQSQWQPSTTPSLSSLTLVRPGTDQMAPFHTPSTMLSSAEPTEEFTPTLIQQEMGVDTRVQVVVCQDTSHLVDTLSIPHSPLSQSTTDGESWTFFTALDFWLT